MPNDPSHTPDSTGGPIDPSQLRPEDRAYLEQHALKKPMGTLHIWALGVGVVIAGEYFGWNGGLGVAGPLGMLLASLFVCLLYMLWVLALSELSVAMPYAGGPLAYGRRAVGPWLGFLMGWSMFLEALFAMIGTGIATGAYIYFLVSLFAGAADAAVTTTVAALAAILVFAAVQWIGVNEQAKITEWLTYGAIVGLVWFWIGCMPGVRIERVFDGPALWTGDWWAGVIKAIPFAIWWLVMIETVALAPEEAREPHRTIPRGLTLAQITLIVLVVLTWFFAVTAGSDYKKTGDESNAFPLPMIYREVWSDRSHLPHVLGFSFVAVFGMVVSFNGQLYAVSRQAFSLGRAGYLPRVLGHVHPERRTPDVSIFVWSLVTAGFVVWSYFDPTMVTNAVLTCNLTALIWYALAMICLFVLRVKEPNMARPYKVPLYPIVPAAVLVMSVFTAGVYGWLAKPIVLWLTAGMYAAGLAYYVFVARGRLASAAPEELAARGGMT